MGRAFCRYEVFPQSEPDDDIEAAEDELVSLSVVDRGDEPSVFEPPKYQAPASRGHTFRVAAPAGDELLAAIVSTTQCYVIEADIEQPEDLSFLEESMALALSIAEATDGVIVDRTSDIGYTLEQFEPQSEDPEIRDTVSLAEDKSGQTVNLVTRGMSKYAEHDFSIEGFPAEHVELARRLLLDNLCPYSAFQDSIEPGQNLQYRGDNPAALLFFDAVDDSTLMVSDMDVSGKRAAKGLSRFLEISLPGFIEQRKKEQFDEAMSRASRLIEYGRDDDALAQLDRALEASPGDVWALGGLVDVLTRLVEGGASGLRERRDELARELLENDDDSFGARSARAHALVAMASDPAEALELSERAVAELPADVQSQLCRAKALLASGKTDEAMGLLAWLETIREGVVCAHVADAASRVRSVDPITPAGAEIPDSDQPVEVAEEPSDPEEPLDEMDQQALRAVRYGPDGWERSRNAAMVALLLEAPMPFDDLRQLRFSDLHLESGHARFDDGYLQLEADTTAKLQHWALTYPAHPGLLGRSGPRYVMSSGKLEPLSAEEVDPVLRAVGDEAGVLGLSLDRIETTFAVQHGFDEDDD